MRTNTIVPKTIVARCICGSDIITLAIVIPEDGDKNKISVSLHCPKCGGQEKLIEEAY